MNTTLLQAAKAFLKNRTAFPQDSPHSALWSLGFAYFDTETASVFLQQAIDRMPHALPLQGVALHHLYQCAKDKKQLKPMLEAFYQAILHQHRALYDLYDVAEEGLPCTPNGQMQIQDPLFLGLLVWSNENLIQIGHLLKEDVLEIIQWNELTIYGMNEKLWNSEQRLYQSFDSTCGQLIDTAPFHSFAPMAGEIPTQDQAELLFPELQRSYRKAPALNVFEQWLLRWGLLRYDFVELAAHLHRRLLQNIEAYGFYENFDRQSGEPVDTSPEQSALTAIITIDLLKRC